MNRIRIKNARRALNSLSGSWYEDEMVDYGKEYGIENPESIPTTLLEPHIYTDLRVLEDFFKELTFALEKMEGRDGS